jgi:hypothetical protein
MALDTNAQQDFSGHPLPHFTPFPTPGSAGVNLFTQCPKTTPAFWDNPYVFPPFSLVGPVVRFLLPFHIPFTIIVPVPCPKPVWWPILKAVSYDSVSLGSKNDNTTILSPTKQGMMPFPCPTEIWMFRVYDE